MGKLVYIMGRSGTGKSYSMKKLSVDRFALINVDGKDLPFDKNSPAFHVERANIDDSAKIVSQIKSFAQKYKSIVVDDFQYVMGNEFMRRAYEKSYDKWTEIGRHAWDIANAVKSLPDDIIVYLMCHTEKSDDGTEKIKTLGKLLDQNIVLEGKSSIVLKSDVVDGKYYFFTQNSGKDTVKSPEGMFLSYAIDNDLQYVDDKIRNYYEVGEYKTDDEMNQADAAVANTEIEKPTTGRKRGGSKSSAKAEEPKTPENGSNDAESGENSTDTTTTATTGGRRSRGSRKTSEKTHDEVVAENQQKVAEYQEQCDAAIDEAAGGAEEVDFDTACEAMDKVPKPELDKVPRRTRKERTASKVEVNDGTTNTDSVTIVLEQDSYFFRPSDGNYLMKHKGDSVDTVVGGVTVLESITKEEFGEGVKKLAQAGNPKTEPMNPPVEDDAPTEGTRTRRTRRTR